MLPAQSFTDAVMYQGYISYHPTPLCDKEETNCSTINDESLEWLMFESRQKKVW